MQKPRDNRDTEHAARMKERKALVDAGIQAAREVRGVVILLYGHGKGKSSSAFGTAARSLGHGLKVGIVQFIKGGWRTGEHLFFRDHPQVTFHVSGAGFTWETQDREKDIRAAESGWIKAAEMLSDERYNLVVLDELTYVLQYGYLEIPRVLTAIRERPPMQNVIVTGRDPVPELVGLSDTASEIKACKHAFQAGVKAQKGIEW